MSTTASEITALAPPGRKYICVGPDSWCWGSSNAMGGAVRAAKKAVPTFLGEAAKKRMSYMLYETGQEAYVTERGQVMHVDPIKLVKKVTWVGDQRKVETFR